MVRVLIARNPEINSGACAARGAMDHFIHRQNIELYRRLLAEPHDLTAERHRMLLKLLADEEAKDQRLPGRDRPRP